MLLKTQYISVEYTVLESISKAIYLPYLQVFERVNREIASSKAL
jgi:hypothetical protein